MSCSKETDWFGSHRRVEDLPLSTGIRLAPGNEDHQSTISSDVTGVFQKNMSHIAYQKWVIFWIEDILHHFIGCLSHYLCVFSTSKLWLFGISSINLISSDHDHPCSVHQFFDTAWHCALKVSESFLASLGSSLPSILQDQFLDRLRATAQGRQSITTSHDLNWCV